MERLERPCAGKLFWVWGAYSWAMLMLWQAAPSIGLAPAAVWIVAGFCGALLALWMQAA